MFAYVGSRTTRERHARGDGISIYRVGDDAGLTLVDVVRDLVNPSYLALDHGGNCLYAVHGDRTEISAFRIERTTGRLALINRQQTGGENPVHLALAPDGRHIVVSNHVTSSLAVLPVAGDGSLGEVAQLVHLEGPLGPHRVEQQMSKPHFNPFSPCGQFVAVPDKGLDRTFIFRFDAGRLTPAAPPFAVAREGAGPRHLAFHPQLELAYVVNELDSTVTACRWGTGDGALQPLQIVPMLPATFTGNSRAAALAIDATGSTLYASNRGHDSIAVFRIDGATGLLALTETVPTGGRTPRAIALAPDGRHLYVMNEDSDTIVALAVHPSTGQLHATGIPVACGSPVCMVFNA